MLALKDEQLNMVSGGEASLQNDNTGAKFDVGSGDIVIWTKYKGQGKGLVIVNIYGICMVKFECSSFPWFYMLFIDEDELKIVGHIEL